MLETKSPLKRQYNLKSLENQESNKRFKRTEVEQTVDDMEQRINAFLDSKDV